MLLSRAVRATVSPVVDGRLDDVAWSDAPEVSGFRQIEPHNGTPSAFTTRVRVLFDDEYLYIGAWCLDTAGISRVRVQDLRRKWDYFANDHFSVVIDPLNSERNSVAFQVTPYGAQRELEVYDGGNQYNREWEAVWRVRTQRTDSGWTAEYAIPWASLRYRLDGQPWTINFSRLDRRTNELSAWGVWPRQFTQHRLEFAGRLDGVEPPPPTRNIRIRPYLLSNTNRLVGGPAGARRAAQVEPQIGGEATWAPTANSVLDLTVNTDFAQADVDRQVINLTRFSVFFPERRQFFLENASLFSLGTDGRFVVAPFFSRRIGLGDDGESLPIEVGARYVNRDARSSMGALAVRQRGANGQGASHFGVVRGVRNFGAQNRAGGLLTVRTDDAANGVDARTSVVAAVDGFVRFSPLTNANGMLSIFRDNDGREGVAATYFVGRTTPRLYTGFLGAVVTEGYAPPTGFVSRSDVVLSSPAIIGDLRPAWKPAWIRNFRPALVSYLYNSPSDARLQEGFVEAYVDVIAQNGSVFYPYVQRHFQRPTVTTPLLPGVTIAPGTHDYVRTGGVFRSDASRKVSFAVRAATGTFFDGRLDDLDVSARIAPVPHVNVGVQYLVNRLQSVGSNDTSFTTHLLAPEIRVSLNPRVQFTGFYQHNTSAQRGVLNARFSWEFAPLSYLFVVLNDRRPLPASGLNEPTAQQIVIKATWLRQF
jgi:hypothetical protein